MAEAQTPVPSVETVVFLGLAAGDSTYYRDEAVRVRVRFTNHVVVDVAGGTPYVDLTVGGETRRARFVASKLNRLDFSYTVQAGDDDDDGVSVAANALALNGATVKAAADGATDADVSHGQFDGGLSRKVDGSRVRPTPTVAPTVEAIVFDGLAAGDSTYYRDEAVRVRVRFTNHVVVDVAGGTPYVDLTVGGETRRARFVASKLNRLDFSYTVQAGDDDDDGVSVAANALALNGATVKAAADGATDADVSHGRFDGGLSRKVDGSRVRPTPVPVPSVETVVFLGLAAGDSTYYRDEAVRVRVRFTNHVVVDVAGGTPYVDLTVGGETRRARFVASKLNRLDFSYTVQAGDDDDDGVSVAANALALNGATVKAAADGATDADVSHGQFDGGLSRKVDGSQVRPTPVPVPSVETVVFLGLATGDSTYYRDDDVQMRVLFTKHVVVDTAGGTPYLDLAVGGATRRAAFVASDRNRLYFSYTVQAGDADDDGVSVAANALALNGATVKAAADGATDADVSHGRFDGGLSRKVDGSQVRPTPTVAPTVEAIVFDGLAAGDSTYYRDEAVRMRVLFTKHVVLDTSGGTPYLGLTVGAKARQADFVGAYRNRLDFSYTVQAGDADDDGVSVAANALALNGATVKAAADGATDADVSHGRFDGGLSRKVDGSRTRSPAPAPAVESILFSGLAADDSVYYRADDVQVRVLFTKHVVVDTSGGTPYLGLTVGEETRRAHFVASKLNRLDFSYTVQAGDTDDDGVSVAANALTLNGATVKAKADRETDADVSHDRFNGGASRKVNGSRVRKSMPAPVVETIVFRGLADGDSTYYIDEVVRVRVRFTDHVVVDTGDGTPYVDLTVGEETRHARFVASKLNRLDFSYTVQAGDADDDGVGVAANALTLNGATVKAKIDSTTDADISHGRFDGGPSRKVDGHRFRPPDGSRLDGVVGNRKPEVVAPIAPKALVLNSEPVADDMLAHIRDPDGDELEFFAVSGTQGVATVEVVGSVLTVNPRAVGQSLVTVRAADPAGADVEHSFQVTVEPSRADRARVMKQSMAAFGRTVGTEAVEAIGSRLRQGSPGAAHKQSHLRLGGRSFSCDATSRRGGCGFGGLARQAYGLLGVRLSSGADRPFDGPGPDAEGIAGAGDPDWRRPIRLNPVSGRNLLSQASFRFSPGDHKQSSLAATDEPPASGWTFWGQANAGGFKGQPDEDLSLDGTVRSGYLGMDYRFGQGPLVGLALSRTTSSIGFESRFATAGTMDVSLTGAYPYVQWSPRSGLSLWGLVGAGRGNAAMSEEATGRRFETDIGMLMTAVGGRQAVVGGLGFRADAFAVRTNTDETQNLAAVGADVYRLRIAPDFGARWAVSAQSTIRSRVELGMRMDGGDAEAGVGAEAGAEFGYAHEGIGLSVEVRGRTLVAHQADAFKDWGASMSVRLEPRRHKEGLSFMLMPTWGNDASRVSVLWRDGAVGNALGRSLGRSATGLADGAERPSRAASRLDIETGYALAFSDIGRVLPFGRWTISGASDYRINVGIRLSVRAKGPGPATDLLAVDVFGQHASGDTGGADGRFGVQGAVRFR